MHYFLTKNIKKVYLQNNSINKNAEVGKKNQFNHVTGERRKNTIILTYLLFAKT